MFKLFAHSFVRGLGYASAWQLVRNWRSVMASLVKILGVILGLAYAFYKALFPTIQ